MLDKEDRLPQSVLMPFISRFQGEKTLLEVARVRPVLELNHYFKWQLVPLADAANELCPDGRTGRTRFTSGVQIGQAGHPAKAKAGGRGAGPCLLATRGRASERLTR